MATDAAEVGGGHSADWPPWKKGRANVLTLHDEASPTFITGKLSLGTSLDSS
jgi:hypothetical protein